MTPGRSGGTERYIRLDIRLGKRGPGLQHVLHSLWSFLGIASALDRIPIIDDRLSFGSHHNYGFEPPECDPRAYRDLDSAVRYGEGLPPGGLPLEYIMRSQADDAGFAERDTLRVAAVKVPGQRQQFHFNTEQDHRRYPLLVLDATAYKTVPHKLFGGTLTNGRRHIIHWQRSPRVVQMADEVIGQMMRKSEGLPEMRGYAERLRAGIQGNYCCVHSRRGDILTTYRSIHPYGSVATDPERIMRTMAAAGGVTPDSAVYLMTDETDPAYMEAFRSRYRNLWTFSDFPQLRALREGPSPNNYLLFDVEWLIQQRACVQVTTRRPLRPPRSYSVETHRVVRIPPPLPYIMHRLRTWRLRAANRLRTTLRRPRP